jgi:type II secretion system protein G
MRTDTGRLAMVPAVRARRLLCRREGFTIIELMTVVVVIGILAIIIIPNYLTFADRAKEAIVKENMHVVHSGVEMFSVDNLGTYPQQADEAALQALMPNRTFPENPFDNAVTQIVWDADPGDPGEIAIIGLANGGYIIKGHGRNRVLDLTIASGD